MKLFKNLKTSEKISLSFALLSFFSIFVFLLLINISYFFIWYSQQKEVVFSSMNETYKNYLTADGKMEEVEAFKSYLLTQDTIIIPDEGEPICSPGVAKKVRMELDQVQEQYFYRDGEIIYVIYSKYFEGIGNVRVFFDTTSYIHSQIIILKVGFTFLLLIVFLQFFIGKLVSRYLLKDLKNIAQKVKNVSLESDKKHITSHLVSNDEIRILAEALNISYDTIDAETQKLKQFLTDVSHEFKTPLMVMNSKLDVLEKRMEKEIFQKQDVIDFFSISRTNIKKMNALIESLFFLSQTESHSPLGERKKTDMQKYFTQKREEFLGHYEHKKLVIDLDIQTDVMYDIEFQTFSILVDNLLHNAIKFSSESPKIRITVDSNYFSIQDSGVGIAEEEIQKIFLKFYRQDTKVEGFGIGLSLVARIAELYGWRIEVKSTLGKGSEFRIIL